MRGYIPALIDLAAVRPTEGVKTGAMDLRSQRTLPPRRVDGPARVRVRRVVTPLSLARQKFHAASRSFSLSLSFFFPFLFSFFFVHTRPRLGNWPPPRTHAPFVRLRSFRVRSSELSSRHSSVSLTSPCSYASLNPFFPFSLSRAFTNFRTICRSVSFPPLGAPASRFFGARDVIAADSFCSSCLTLTVNATTLCTLRARGT